jgi:hypothetical protein
MVLRLRIAGFPQLPPSCERGGIVLAIIGRLGFREGLIPFSGGRFGNGDVYSENL